MSRHHALRADPYRCPDWEGISFQGTAQPRTACGELQFPLQHQLLAKTRSRLRPRQTAAVRSRLPRHVAKHRGPASARPATAHPKATAMARRRASPTCHPSKNRPVALFTADSNTQDILKLLSCCKVSLNWLPHPDLLANFLLCHQSPRLIQQERALVRARVVTDPRPARAPQTSGHSGVCSCAGSPPPPAPLLCLGVSQRDGPGSINEVCILGLSPSGTDSCWVTGISPQQEEMSHQLPRKPRAAQRPSDPAANPPSLQQGCVRAAPRPRSLLSAAEPLQPTHAALGLLKMSEHDLRGQEGRLPLR